MSDVSNVTYGKPKIGGAIHTGAASAVLPTDATSKLVGFTSLGYISEDGLSNETKLDSNKIKAWGGDTILTTNKGREDTFKYKLVESLNIDVLKEVFGSENVTGTLTDGITVKVNSAELPEHKIAVDMIMKGGVLKRICIPNATVIEIGEVNYADEDAVGYELTINAAPDADGNTHYEYIKKPGA